MYSLCMSFLSYFAQTLDYLDLEPPSPTPSLPSGNGECSLKEEDEENEDEEEIVNDVKDSDK